MPELWGVSKFRDGRAKAHLYRPYLGERGMDHRTVALCGQVPHPEWVAPGEDTPRCLHCQRKAPW
jgi:hypothetical protein